MGWSSLALCPKLDRARLEKRLRKLIYESEWSVLYESQDKVEIGHRKVADPFLMDRTVHENWVARGKQHQKSSFCSLFPFCERWWRWFGEEGRKVEEWKTSCVKLRQRESLFPLCIHQTDPDSLLDFKALFFLFPPSNDAFSTPEKKDKGRKLRASATQEFEPVSRLWNWGRREKKRGTKRERAAADIQFFLPGRERRKKERRKQRDKTFLVSWKNKGFFEKERAEEEDEAIFSTFVLLLFVGTPFFRPFFRQSFSRARVCVCPESGQEKRKPNIKQQDSRPVEKRGKRKLYLIDIRQSFLFLRHVKLYKTRSTLALLASSLSDFLIERKERRGWGRKKGLSVSFSFLLLLLLLTLENPTSSVNSSTQSYPSETPRKFHLFPSREGKERKKEKRKKLDSPMKMKGK